jgi:4'-phosphopantetheinyl transferase EntD
MAFEKGNKLGGRKKLSKSFKDFVKAHSVEAINNLWAIAKNKDEKTTDRIAANKIIIEYAEGKAPQPLIGGDGKPLIPKEEFGLGKFTTAEKEKMLKNLLNETKR